jgi:hypothetical protein
LSARRGDASDADAEIYEKLVDEWQEAGPQTRPTLREIDTDGEARHSLDQAIDALRRAGLMP